MTYPVFQQGMLFHQWWLAQPRAQRGQQSLHPTQADRRSIDSSTAPEQHRFRLVEVVKHDDGQLQIRLLCSAGGLPVSLYELEIEVTDDRTVPAEWERDGLLFAGAGADQAILPRTNGYAASPGRRRTLSNPSSPW